MADEFKWYGTHGEKIATIIANLIPFSVVTWNCYWTLICRVKFPSSQGENTPTISSFANSHLRTRVRYPLPSVVLVVQPGLYIVHRASLRDPVIYSLALGIFFCPTNYCISSTNPLSLSTTIMKYRTRFSDTLENFFQCSLPFLSITLPSTRSSPSISCLLFYFLCSSLFRWTTFAKFFRPLSFLSPAIVTGVKELAIVHVKYIYLYTLANQGQHSLSLSFSHTHPSAVWIGIPLLLSSFLLPFRFQFNLVQFQANLDRRHLLPDS